MRLGRSWALLLMVCLTLAVTAGVAWAHVKVSPGEVPANDFARLAVSVPTEKDIPTTQVRVEIPDGFVVSGVQPVSGWTQDLEEDGGGVKAITWSGGEIRPQEFQEFVFQARTPEDAGQYSWKAYQTYEDGSVVEWTGPPEEETAGGSADDESDKGPASVVEVVGGGIRSSEPGAIAPQSGGGFTRVAAYGGLGLGALALVVALLALFLGRRRKTS